jgi:hypothetical protein
VLGVGEGDLGTLPLFYPSKIAQVLEKGTTGTFPLFFEKFFERRGFLNWCYMIKNRKFQHTYIFQ